MIGNPVSCGKKRHLTLIGYYVFREHSPLSRHSGIKWEDVKKYPKLLWCYHGLSMNPNVPMSSILARTDLKWNWMEVCKRPDFLYPINEHEARKYFATKKTS